MIFDNFDLIQTDFRQNSRGATFRLQLVQADSEAYHADKFDLIELRRIVESIANNEVEKSVEYVHLGKSLGDILLPEKFREFFLRRLDAARKERRGVRLRLHFNSLELQALPWEYMLVNSAGSEPTETDFLLRQSDISIVRCLTNWDAYAGKLTSERSTVAAFACPKGFTALNLDTECQNLQCLFDKDADGQLKICKPATVQDLSQLPNSRCVVFHFSGHGLLKQLPGPQIAKTVGVGAILLEDENGAPVEMSAAELVDCLRNPRTNTNLAVLNACVTAQRADLNQWSSVAEQLMKAGVGMVVGMQFNVLDDKAINFSKEFYTVLLAGGSVDEALSAARFAIRDDLRSFGTPVLFMNKQEVSGRIFKRLVNSNQQAVRATAAQFGDKRITQFSSVAIASASASQTGDFLKASLRDYESKPMEALPEDPFPPFSGVVGDGGDLALTTKWSLFANRQKYLVGDTIVVPLRQGESAPIYIYGGQSGFHTVEVVIDSYGSLMLKPWGTRYQARRVEAGNAELLDWPNRRYQWLFRRCDLDDELVLASNTRMAFDPQVVQAAWRIWHKHAGTGELQFLVMLAQADVNQI